MITIKDFMETIDYKITEGSDYGWQCYGYNVHRFDSWNGLHDDGGYTISCVFDTQDQTVYEMEAYDYGRNRAYRWIHPDYVQAHNEEAQARNVDPKQAWDDVNFVELETTEDMLAKARAIVLGEEYDTRIDVPLRLDKDALFELMTKAHERDITLNQLVEDVLRNVIAAHETGTDDPIDFPMRDEYDFSEAEQGNPLEAVKKLKKKKSKK